MENKVYICEPCRSPVGSFQGALASISASRIAAQVLKNIYGSAKLSTDSIDEVILGSVLTAGQGQAPARQALIEAGLSVDTQALTVNKVCSSGLKAVMIAASQVSAGDSQAVIAGGMENMSLAPYLLPSLRSGARLGHTSAEDSIVKDGLWDPYGDVHMGTCAELCAKEYQLSREVQDEFALESYRRANESISEGRFKAEIVPIEVEGRKGTTVVSQDEEPGGLKPEKVSKLKAVFKKEGTVTAANASSINDGAAAMLVCSERFYKENGLKPIAKILSVASHAQKPEWFTTAPIGAINAALGKAERKVEDIGLFEINEAFSAVALACARELKISPEKLNVNGGSVAIGHPIGASGARILVTLLHAMKQRGESLGAAGICNGGGEATAIVVEAIAPK